MTAGPGWAAAAADEILGWRAVDVSPLPGSDLRYPVARVRLGASSVVLKRYRPPAFAAARLVGNLPDAPFAPIVGESTRRCVLAFEDLGTRTLLDLIPEDAAGRRRVAGRYIGALADAVAALGVLGAPPPVRPVGSLNAFLGFSPLTTAARRLVTPGSQLLAIARATRREPPPAACRSAARDADDALALALDDRVPHRRWILQDTNPSNLVVGDDDRAGWVDVLPVPGLPETTLLTLAGSSFRLGEDEVASILNGQGRDEPQPAHLRTLNGLFSVLTLCDTCLGIVDGSRDGLVHSGLAYAQSEDFSLRLAQHALSDGVAAARGYLPMIEWLRSTAGSWPLDGGPGDRGAPW